MKEIKDFPGYFITEDGRVLSAIKQTGLGIKVGGSLSYIDYTNLKELKRTIKSSGYCTVGLRKNGKTYSKLVHRLVAENFISNPSNLPFVNHIDENKANNNIKNLEWCTPKSNNVHSKCRWIWTIENVSTKEVYVVTNLAEFCINHNLHIGQLSATRTRKKFGKHKNYRVISKLQFK